MKPHFTKGFKVSNDPKFEEKVTDIVGLYLDPPDRAVVLRVDEKSQIQALDRTQPGLPLKKGRAATVTHDYKMGWLPPFRNGALIVKRIKTTQKQRDADGISRDQGVGAAETSRIVAAPTPV